MNKDQTQALIRQVVQVIGTLLVGRGVLSSGDASTLETATVTIAGGLAMAGPIIWAWMAHTHTAMIQSVNAANNGVKVVDQQVVAPTVNASLK